ncbi:MAG: bifunctional ornithine acetyltransferase/N-acetylglutamate synthase [Acidimicrobiales bacterium]
MSVTAPAGFVAAGVACGVKASGALDLALVATDDARPVPAAGVFTRNRMTAAPVLVSRHHLDATGGHAAAVVLNSGNANAATGAPGTPTPRPWRTPSPRRSAPHARRCWCARPG